LQLRVEAISTETTLTLPDGSQFQYRTNLGSRPHGRWPAAAQFEDLPAWGVFDQVNKTVQDFPREKAVTNTLPCQIRIFLKRSPNADEVDDYIGDVMRAIVTNHETGAYDPTFGGLAIDTKPDEDGFIVPRETFEIDGAAVGFTVEFLSGPFDAYD
jgi:hypothetical protein